MHHEQSCKSFTIVELILIAVQRNNPKVTKLRVKVLNS